jgi:NAD(P)-dependent dehydrogenase (short-subunit alcohol dehydrogenase family)
MPILQATSAALIARSPRSTKRTSTPRWPTRWPVVECKDEVASRRLSTRWSPILNEPRVALVTGASSGIGFATAALLAARGYRTFGTSRKPQGKTGPKNVEMVELDVRSDESVCSAMDNILRQTDHIDVLVNNAGFGLFGAVEETSLAEARAQLETNFWGAVRLTDQVLPGMRERRSGRIINVTSVLGFMPAPFHAYYVASKHALEGYSEVLALEVRPFGVFVTAIEPSWIRSRFFENREEAKKSLDAYQRERDLVSPQMRERTEHGRDPDVVARVIYKAVTSPNPAVRYTVDLGAGSLKVARSFLPSSVFDRLLRRSFGLNNA